MIHILTWLKSNLNINVLLILLLGFNAILMMMPHETRRRMKTSSDLFWPPWQDRSTTLQPDQAATASPTSPPRLEPKQRSVESPIDTSIASSVKPDVSANTSSGVSRSPNSDKEGRQDQVKARPAHPALSGVALGQEIRCFR